MNSPEDDIFQRMMSGIELQTTVREHESLEHVKDVMLSSLRSHISALNCANIIDEDTRREVSKTLSYLVSNDFAYIEGLEYGDEVVSFDSTRIVVIDMLDWISETFDIDASAEIRGDLRDVIVDTMPSADDINPCAENHDPESTTSFEVGLVLKDVIIRHDDEPTFIPSHKLVFVPMGKAPFPMKKAG